MSHNVVFVPEVQQFLLEDYVWWVSVEKKKEAHQLVCDCWRKVRLKAIEQGFWSCKHGKVLSRQAQGLLSACGISMFVHKFDQCVEFAGEPARRWRWLLTEYCEGSG